MGKELILATKPFAGDSAAKSWAYVGSTSALLLCAIAGTLFGGFLLVKIFSSVLTGLLILRLFVIYHDQQHHAILGRSVLAEKLGWLYGILSLNPSSVWRSSHDFHHKHNSKMRSASIGSFPIMTRLNFENSTERERRRYLFVRHPLTILFGYIFGFLYEMCLKPFMRNPKLHYDCGLALGLHFIFGVSLIYFGGWSALFLTLLIPCFIAYAFGSYLFYAQHNFPSVSFADQRGWTIEKAAMESSSHLITGRLMSWFTANIGLHHVHHLNAKIPFYRLREALREIPELKFSKRTSLNPVEMYRCLQLKVWDVDLQKMVTLKESAALKA